MERSDLWRLAGALILVLANGFFVAAEFGIVKIRGTRLQELADAGSVRARAAQGIQKRLNVYLSATQLGITLCSLALGWIAEPAMAEPLEARLTNLGPLTVPVAHAIATVLALVVITFLHTVVGELFPKSLAIGRTEMTALWTAAPLALFFRIMARNRAGLIGFLVLVTYWPPLSLWLPHLMMH